MTVMVEAVNLAVPALNLLHPRGCGVGTSSVDS